MGRRYLLPFSGREGGAESESENPGDDGTSVRGNRD